MFSFFTIYKLIIAIHEIKSINTRIKMEIGRQEVLSFENSNKMDESVKTKVVRISIFDAFYDLNLTRHLFRAGTREER